jgi:hypothetical protein
MDEAYNNAAGLSLVILACKLQQVDPWNGQVTYEQVASMNWM